MRARRGLGALEDRRLDPAAGGARAAVRQQDVALPLRALAALAFGSVTARHEALGGDPLGDQARPYDLGATLRGAQRVGGPVRHVDADLDLADRWIAGERG